MEVDYYVLFPAGEAGAHRVLDHTDAPPRYLCFSAVAEPEVTVYPDPGEPGIFAGSAPGAITGGGRGVDYYEGEG